LRINILGCPYYSATLNETTNLLLNHIKRNGQLLQVVTANSSILVNSKTNHKLQEILKDNDNVVLCDGQPVVWSSFILGTPLPERVSGIDLMKSLLELSNKNNASIYFLGSTESTLKKMIKNLNLLYPNLNILGCKNGYFKEEEIDMICKEIKELQPNILFVAMGSPKQEFFIKNIKDHISKEVNVAIGVGGSFEVLAGLKQRAPKWVQVIGMEWFYRMIQEPRRLFKRYLYTNTMFIILLIKELVGNLFKRHSES
jgi:N-acetylglucosaminyldiphosphoundecaprenol N-acetyl-beta-D-mannosaminyltransferase